MIGSYTPWFIEEMGRRLQREQLEKAEILATGFAADYGEYRHECGIVQGLKRAAEIAAEIKQEVDKA